MTRKRAGLAVGAAVLLLVAIAGGGYLWQRSDDSALPSPESSAPPAAGQSATGGGEGQYVALGDSYTSAPQIGPAVGPSGCHRSENNYPHLMAAELDPAGFVDVSCGGATTAHLTTPQDIGQEVQPPQLDALTPDTTLVTLGIGGNDVGLVQLASECVSSEQSKSPCRDRLTAGGLDRLAEAIKSTETKVSAALTEIHDRAPQARVLVVGYPTVLPAPGEGCWPELPIGAPDVAYLRDALDALNTMLDEQAAAGGAEFVDTATPTLGHDICRPQDVRWVEGLTSTADSAPLHPTARGQQAMAEAVLAELNRPGP
ncbi:GDSL-like Lipase/Acylhydrolase family protein [Amycolatopsis marina]|uniref:GDSL-like Lipase/Acylhydrolase family protein n=1 Tax=Amycolatopsis marina TaxID=490629 RepID=A0A1I0X908_9PSEU|nr:SGNH/GDSL hydrolase family protein [Amycolatopsis marina]SFA97344.1 GDSL-like Lipase/Acylhydrolase family protein [Amycolatopsis marina]